MTQCNTSGTVRLAFNNEKKEKERRRKEGMLTIEMKSKEFRKERPWKSKDTVREETKRMQCKNKEKKDELE